MMRIPPLVYAVGATVLISGCVLDTSDVGSHEEGLVDLVTTRETPCGGKNRYRATTRDIPFGGWSHFGGGTSARDALQRALQAMLANKYRCSKTCPNGRGRRRGECQGGPLITHLPSEDPRQYGGNFAIYNMGRDGWRFASRTNHNLPGTISAIPSGTAFEVSCTPCMGNE